MTNVFNLSLKKNLFHSSQSFLCSNTHTHIFSLKCTHLQQERTEEEVCVQSVLTLLLLCSLALSSCPLPLHSPSCISAINKFFDSFVLFCTFLNQFLPFQLFISSKTLSFHPPLCASRDPEKGKLLSVMSSTVICFLDVSSHCHVSTRGTRCHRHCLSSRMHNRFLTLRWLPQWLRIARRQCWCSRGAQPACPNGRCEVISGPDRQWAVWCREKLCVFYDVPDAPEREQKSLKSHL